MLKAQYSLCVAERVHHADLNPQFRPRRVSMPPWPWARAQRRTIGFSSFMATMPAFQPAEGRTAPEARPRVSSECRASGRGFEQRFTFLLHLLPLGTAGRDLTSPNALRLTVYDHDPFGPSTCKIV